MTRRPGSMCAADHACDYHHENNYKDCPAHISSKLSARYGDVKDSIDILCHGRFTSLLVGSDQDQTTRHSLAPTAMSLLGFMFLHLYCLQAFPQIPFPLFGCDANHQN